MAGQLTDDDLKFVLSVDPDVDAVNRALAAMGKNIDEAGKQAGPGFFKNFLTTGLGTFAGVTAAATIGIPVVGMILSPFTAALNAVSGIFQNLTSSFTEFASKASPGAVDQWGRAFDNVSAAIGDALVPIMELLTQGVQLFADTLKNLLPNMAEVRSALSEFREALGELFAEWRTILTEIGPTIRGVLIDGLRQLSHWLAVAARAVTILADKLRVYFGGAIGQTTEGFRTAQAARPAHIDSIEQYQRGLQIAAASTPGGLSKEDQQLEALEDISTSIDDEAESLAASLERGFGTAITIARESLEVLKIIADILAFDVRAAKGIHGILKQNALSDETAAKIYRVIDTGTATWADPGQVARETKLNATREAMRQAHPEYFTGTH